MYDQILIGGRWQESSSGERIELVDPATEEVFATVPRGRTTDVDEAVRNAHDALSQQWQNLTPSERGGLLYRVADALEEHASELAELDTQCMGKPLTQSRRDVATTIKYFRYYGGAADKLEGQSIPLGRNQVDFTLLEPLGVTAHIVPWNFPLSLAARSVAPALAAGNTVVIKPDEHTPLTALYLGALCLEAGFPEGVVNVVPGYGPEAGAPLVQHPLVRGVTFTGSVSTGKHILRMAADSVKPVILELGGKNPLLVFPDADLEKTLDDTIRAGFSNAGQICSSSSRLLLHRAIYNEYLERLRERTGALSVGPGVENYDIGPLVSVEQYERVEDYIKIGVADGARLMAGGGRPSELKKGYFLEPTIFGKTSPEMRIAREEIFGPVICALPFEKTEEAVKIANHVSYGLVAGIYTQDITRALRLARDIEAGQVYINEWGTGGFIAPFGGYKESGLGREKGMIGLRNYVQIKNVGIRI